MMIFELDDADITLEFSYPTFMIKMAGGYCVSIENSFTLRLGNEIFHIDPRITGDSPKDAAIATFCCEKLRRIEISDNSHLTLTTAGGSTIQVDPNPDYGSWDVNGPDHLKIICGSGGRLEVWRAEDNQPFGDASAGEPS